MEQPKGQDIIVNMDVSLASLRTMLKASDAALKNWPGGDPQEQIDLQYLKEDIYAITMTVLLENGLI